MAQECDRTRAAAGCFANQVPLIAQPQHTWITVMRCSAWACWCLPHYANHVTPLMRPCMLPLSRRRAGPRARHPNHIMRLPRLVHPCLAGGVPDGVTSAHNGNRRVMRPVHCRRRAKRRPRRPRGRGACRGRAPRCCDLGRPSGGGLRLQPRCRPGCRHSCGHDGVRDRGLLSCWWCLGVANAAQSPRQGQMMSHAEAAYMQARLLTCRPAGAAPGRGMRR